MLSFSFVIASAVCLSCHDLLMLNDEGNTTATCVHLTMNKLLDCNVEPKMFRYAGVNKRNNKKQTSLNTETCFIAVQMNAEQH